jgi:hypothetical protein
MPCRDFLIEGAGPQIRARGVPPGGRTKTHSGNAL